MYQKTIKSFDKTDIYYIINRVENNADFLIFIHGAGSNHTIYKPFFPAFADRNFIAVDLRNHGKSGRCPLESITIQALAQDIHAVMEEENIATVTLIGNSLGASVVLELYKRQRKLIKKMVLFTLFSKRYIRYASVLNVLAAAAFIIVKPFSGIRKLHFQEYHKYQKRPIWYYPYLDIRGTPIGTVLKLVRELFSYQLSIPSIFTPTLLFICLDDMSTKNSLIQSDVKGNQNISTIHLKSHHTPLTRNHEEIIRHVQRFCRHI